MLPLPVAPRCAPPLASSSGASRHHGHAQVTLEFVVRPSLVSPVSSYPRLYLPAFIAAPYSWRLRVALFPTFPNFHSPFPTSLAVIRSAACAVAVTGAPWKQQLPSPTLVPAPIQPVSLRSSPGRVPCSWARHMGISAPRCASEVGSVPVRHPKRKGWPKGQRRNVETPTKES